MVWVGVGGSGWGEKSWEWEGWVAKWAGLAGDEPRPFFSPEPRFELWFVCVCLCGCLSGWNDGDGGLGFIVQNLLVLRFAEARAFALH